MEKSIEVVDDFYRDPVGVRKAVLNGLADATAGSEFLSVAGDLLAERLFDITRLISGGGAISYSDADFSVHYRLLKEGDANGFPEIPVGSWVALTWLNLPEQCCGGFHHLLPDEGSAAVGAHVDREAVFVAQQFNRMVLFKTSAGDFVDGPGYGDGPATARLAQVCTIAAPVDEGR